MKDEGPGVSALPEKLEQAFAALSKYEEAHANWLQAEAELDRLKGVTDSEHSRLAGEDWLERDESDDPHAPWAVAAYCRIAGKPTPPWVLAWLQRAAEEVLNAVASPSDGVSEAEAVGRALGFGARGQGRETIGARNRAAARHLEIALSVTRREKAGVQRSASIREAAEESFVSVGTVYNALGNMGDLAQALLFAFSETHDLADKLPVARRPKV